MKNNLINLFFLWACICCNRPPNPRPTKKRYFLADLCSCREVYVLCKKEYV